MHGLKSAIEDNWLSEDFVVFKVDMSNAFKMVSRQAVWTSVLHSSRSFCHGSLGVMGHTPPPSPMQVPGSLLFLPQA